MRFRRRLRTRLLLSFLLLGFGLTTLFAAATIYLRSRLENQLVESWLLREASNFVEFKRENPAPDANFTFSKRIEGFVYRPDRPSIPFAWRKLPTGVHTLSEMGVDGETRQYKLAVFREADIVGFLRYDYTQETITQRQLVIALVLAVVAFTLLAWFVGLWLSSRVISPLSELASTIRRFKGTGMPERLAPKFANDEVGEIAVALDDYSERMTALVGRDREFNADVSHELRTPLAVIRGATELLIASADLPEKSRVRLRRIERASQRCTDLTTALLMLSRSERAQGETPLYRLAEQLAEAERDQLARKPVQIVLEGDRDLIVAAPEAVLAVACGNLLGNACKYTQEGEVRIVVEPNGFRVLDTGPGLSAEDAARLFDRGYRGSAIGKTQGGGIGLSIVRRLCELYQWEVSIRPREEGGAEAVLHFDGVVPADYKAAKLTDPQRRLF